MSGTARSAAACVACGSTAWSPLPDVGAGRSVTTAGQIVDEPLAKAHCRGCGLVQRRTPRLLADTDYYDRRYSFFDRPGAERFDRDRYDAMANWIRESVQSEPATALDVGCGRGWMLDAMRRVWPRTRFIGIEPSADDSEKARRRGLDVRTARLGDNRQATYDLVYATNVLEHTRSPAEFLIGLRRACAPGGQVVITCPDASTPNQDIMFSDQNFSFLPAHLQMLAGQAGLDVEAWHGPPPVVSLRDKQLVVFRTADRDAPTRSRVALLPADNERLYEARNAYVASWRDCDARLTRACKQCRQVYNFGTSTWSFLLAGYCPHYWRLVTACIIDGGGGEFLGKPVSDVGTITLRETDAVVLGVDPASQHHLAARFAGSPARLVTWNDLIGR